jgi:hypothetical protein
MGHGGARARGVRRRVATASALGCEISRRVKAIRPIRIPFALASHAAHYPQGLTIGELLLALAVTFAAQNTVIWMRSGRLATQLLTDSGSRT